MELMGEPFAEVSSTQRRMQQLLEAVLAVSRDLDLPNVLRRIVGTAMELVNARYGALGVLTEHGESLSEFIPVGLTERERADLSGVEFPRGGGLLGYLIRHPEPLRVEEIARHPKSVGFPPGHPPMHSLFGVAIRVRDQIYGNLYLSDRRDGQPFDAHDETVLVALAGAAGVAIENARLYEQLRSATERFQRMLLPSLPDLYPFTAAAVYQPASTPDYLGGDWYDAMLLPDSACAAIIGDVVGHDLRAAAAMAQTRNMLRAVLYDRRTPPSAVLSKVDQTLQAITENPVTTVCLARIEPSDHGWQLHWSSAGHPPPLLLTPDGFARYLETDPGLPLGVEPDHPRTDHTYPLPGGSTVVLFTDGLVEHPRRHLDEGLHAVAAAAATALGEPLASLVQTLADNRPSSGSDDLALLAVRVPAEPPGRVER
ncbi:GAF domain-containing SpoIIE family protein phosphatase [Kitasatospora sp. HUAS MG31]|uniref:GAF domain-containing SpoIIE family protein phosphatase n=2 Tax=Kitasatospora camelliae TaxID=3156397 RepID=A0AAU8K5C0_9ACTN